MNTWINKNALVTLMLFSKKSRHFRYYSCGDVTPWLVLETEKKKKGGRERKSHLESTSNKV